MSVGIKSRYNVEAVKQPTDTKPAEKMDLDDIYRRIGEWGPRQKLFCVFLFLGQAMTALHMILMVFVGNTSEFNCVKSSATVAKTYTRKETSVQACQNYRRGHCDTFIFLSHWVSLPEEMSLVCDEAYKIDFSQSVFMGGILVGSLVWGVVSDAVGRLKTIYVTICLMVAGCLCLGFISSFSQFVFLRFLIGFGIGGHGVAGFVLGCELIGGSKRALFSVLFSVFFAFGICGLAGLALMVSHWRQLCLAASLITFLNFLLYLKLPESPRWLVSQGKVEEAKRVLESIARGNGSRETSGYELKLPPDVVGSDGKKQAGSSPGLEALFTNWTVLKWTVILLYSWFANSAVYYGLTMASGKLSSNLYLSLVLSGLVELPAYAFIMAIHSRIGRKTLITGSMVVGGGACVCVLLVGSGGHSETIRTALALVGKLGISASFVGVYLHSGEVFPTVIRNAGLGICSMAARAGGVAAPVFLVVGTYYPSREFLIFGLVGFSSGLLNLQLPETLGKPLPETMSDMLKLDPNCSPVSVRKSSSAHQSVAHL